MQLPLTQSRLPDRIAAVILAVTTGILFCHRMEPGPKLPTKNDKLQIGSLFKTEDSVGNQAICHAEGNCFKGRRSRSIAGHIDPGNHVVNRGFCSWNRASNLTVAEANHRCLAALQRQSAATEQKLADLGVNPKSNIDALVNGTDLWNQSQRAGADFPLKYKQALDKGLRDRRALIYARVESFRNEARQLDASGLFGICTRIPYFISQLRGKKPYSESWRWQCIALDQGRRIEAIKRVLDLKNVGKGSTQHSSARGLPSHP